MWGLLKKKRGDCDKLGNLLEDGANVATLEPGLREHAETCPDCRAAADDLGVSRELLKALPSQAETPRLWFAPRVMAAIAAREVELKRSLEAWGAVPKLAAKLTWVSALALLLASGWLYRQPPTSAPTKPAITDSVFESVPSTPSNDDVLLSRIERPR